MLKRVQSFLFNNTTTRQTVIKNVVWLGISNFGGRFIRAIIIVYGARILGAEGWGVFSYGVTLAAILTPFTDVGLSQFLIRETAKNDDPAHRARVFSTTLSLKLVLLLLGVLIILVAAPWFTTIEEAKVILPIIAFLLAFDTLREFGAAITRALERMEWEAGLFLATNVAIVLAGFGFLLLSPTAESFTWGYTVGTGIGAALTFVVLRGYIPRNLIASFSKRLVRPILSAAWPLSIASLLGILMINTDILIIGWLRSAEEVGFYSAAYRVVQLLYLLPGILASSAFPTFSRLADNHRAQMRSTLERTLAVVFIMALPLAAGGLLLAPQIIELLFGSEFLPGTAPFQILMLTLLADFPVVVLAHAAFAYNRPKLLTAYAAIGGVLNVALDFLLIPSFGITGCAWATLIAQVCSTAYLRRKVKQENPFSVLPRLSIAFTATAIMAGGVLLFMSIKLPVLLSVALGAAIYGAVLYFLKEPSLREAKQAIMHS
ncbi:MAG: flippase [Candidatus Liptonbacteria bacterium]|nr:flippase [Candidatus Liptonbacteria bacterium]